MKTSPLRLLILTCLLMFAPLLAKAQQPYNSSMNACDNTPIPLGWAYTDRVRDTIHLCTSPYVTTQYNYLLIYQRFYTLSSGVNRTVCVETPNITGWEEVPNSRVYSTSQCVFNPYPPGPIGGPYPPNVKTIRRTFPSSIDNQKAFVYYHYVEFLERYPDQGGWDYWTNEITKCGADQACIDRRRIEVSHAYFDSNEFVQNNPDLNIAYRESFYPAERHNYNVAFVRECYRRYLFREGEQSGIDYWVGQLDATRDYHRMIGNFITSAEYRNRFQCC